MTPTGERALGGLIALIAAVVLILVWSPFFNWMNGYGFRWIF
jgi:hypothetical protein